MMMKDRLCPPVTLVVTLLTMLSVSKAAPLVSTQWANIAGVDLQGPGGRGYSGYLGIPYAAPPVGARRFLKAQPPPPSSNNFFNASSAAPVCAQPSATLKVGQGMSEDCLYLNVFVPARASPAAALPVLVWIHGGAFLYQGAGSFTPSKLVADQDVVVVVIQFRLGVFGFLSSASAALPGNLGLWDQNLALRWVRDNIRAFGGDPDRVTLSGQSSGSISVALHALSPYSKGLFRRALMQSGGPSAPLAVNETPRPFFLNLSAEAGCRSADDSVFSRYTASSDKDLVRCLSTKSTEELLRAGVTSLPQASFEFRWVPVVDGNFIPMDPRDLLGDEEYLLSQGLADKDFLFSVNNQEGNIVLNTLGRFQNVTVANAIDNDFFGTLLDFALLTRLGVAEDEVVSEMVNFTYTYPRDTSGRRTLTSLMHLYADISFIVPVVEFARAVSSVTTAAANGARYLYLFDVYPESNRNTLAPGSRHGDELAFLFDSTKLSVLEDQVSNLFVSFVAAFVKSGNPSSAVSNALGGAAWPRFSRDTQTYLAFSQNPSISNNLYDSRVALWTDVVPRLATYRQRRQQEEATQAHPLAYFTGWFNVQLCPLRK